MGASRADAGVHARPPSGLAAAGGAVLYLALDVAFRAVDLPADRTIPWYPASGVGLATLMIAGPRYAPLLAGARFLGGIWPRRFQGPVWAVLVEAVLLAAIYAGAAMLARRHVALDGRGWRVRDAAWLVGTSLGATALAALVASTQIVVWRHFPWTTFGGHAFAWWAGDAIGALVMVPLVLFVVAPLIADWHRAPAAGPKSATEPAAVFGGSPDEAPVGRADGAGGGRDGPLGLEGRTLRRVEYAAQAAAVALAGAIVLTLRIDGTIADGFVGYVCFIPLTWAALRSGVRGGALVATAFAGGATALVTAQGAAPADVRELQFLLLTLAALGLFLGAARTAADEGEARYWHLLASANEGVWRADRDWRTVYVNRRLAELLGYPARAMAGRHVLDFMHPDSVPDARSRFTAAGAGLAETYEIALQRADGAPLHALVHGSPVRSATTGAPLGAVALVTDVTALRTAEAARRRSEHLLEAAFRTSRDAMALVYADACEIVDVNDRWSELTGLGRDTLLAASTRAADPAHAHGPGSTDPGWGGLGDASRLLAAMREHGAVHDLELVVRGHRGPAGASELRHVVVTASPAVADGTTHYLVTARDITAERQGEQRRGQLQRLEELGRLAGGVAHDFNNLLTVIGSFAELVEEDATAGQPPTLADIHEIRRGVARGRDLTRRLLAFSRHQVVEPRRVDPATALRDAERLVQSVVGTRVALELRLDGPLPPILADAGQLDQVLLNLAANARDAMGGVGRFTIGAHAVQVAPGDVATVVGPDALPGAYVVLTATDTGAGMSAATQTRIFEPFFTTKASGEGTGLGLAVVFGIVRQAHGVIRVESAPGDGTTFTIFWPAAPRAGDAEGAVAAPTPTRTDQITVLLVDDEDAVRDVARRLLERAGYAVVDARHGAEALTRLDSMVRLPDVVLTDVVMPVLGGRELAVRLAARWPALPVLLMTGYAGRDAHGDSGGDLRDGLPNVRAAVVEKPFTGERLLGAIQGVLRDVAVAADSSSST